MSRKHNNNDKQSDNDNKTSSSIKFKTYLTEEKILHVINKCSMKIQANKCYPESIHFILSKKEFNAESCDIKKIHENAQVIEKHNIEKFYSVFFGNIVQNSSDIFPEITSNASTLLCAKLADSLVVEFKKFQKGEQSEMMETETPVLTEREVAGLQYLGGYVAHNLYRKYKNKKNWKDNYIQHALSILFACKCENDQLKNQKLINALNRGGLWAIKEELQQLLIKCEIEFRKITSTSVRSININIIVSKLIKDIEIFEIFSKIVEEAPLKTDNEELKKTILQSIFELYLKVRSHSHAKDIINKYKQKKYVKKKSLRTELKKMNELTSKKLDAWL